MKLSFDLTESQNQKLDAAANRLGIPREELAKAALDELLARPEAEFDASVTYVLSKNEGLYRRLS